MRVIGTKLSNLAELSTNLFVRKSLDQDRVLFLAELIESGVKMTEPIEVTATNEVVDGRHRKEAYELNSVKEVEVRVLEFSSRAELIAYAYRANAGGSKPPTSADTEHTIMLLLSMKESIKKIGEALGLPPNLARKYVADVKSRMDRAQLQRAAAAVTDGGLTVTKAAEQYEVDPERLKEILSGKRRKSKNGIQDLHRGLTTLYKSVSSRNAATLRGLIEKYQDGDVTEKQVREILDHLKDLQRQSTRSVSDWEARFNAMANPAEAEKL
jgi:ParB-like chromosome segregation protein Spo0J